MNDAARLSGALQPTFFLVGNPKSGTTTLDALLDQHPGLLMCRPKDPHHFATDLLRADHGVFRPSTWEEHQQRFSAASDGQVLGESSACYTLSKVAIEDIASRVPDARIIVMFREPVSLLRSWHLQLLRDPKLERQRDFRVALELEPRRRRGERLPRGCVLPELLAYSDLVRYTTHLDRLHAAFSPQQVLVVLHDDLATDPVGTARRVFRFLGVDDEHEIEPDHRNLGATVISSRLEDLRNRVIADRDGDSSVVRWASKLVYRHLSIEQLHSINAGAKRVLHRRPAAVDPALVAELRAEHAPEVAALGEQLGVDLLTQWACADPSASALPPASPRPMAVVERR